MKLFKKLYQTLLTPCRMLNDDTFEHSRLNGSEIYIKFTEEDTITIHSNDKHIATIEIPEKFKKRIIKDFKRRNYVVVKKVDDESGDMWIDIYFKYDDEDFQIEITFEDKNIIDNIRCFYEDTLV